MAETLSTYSLKPGAPAPDFELPSSDGTLFTRDQIQDVNGLLVVFVCNHCPFVVMLAEEFGRFASHCQQRGIGVVAISSNDIENYPQDAPEFMAKFAKQNGWDFPYLHDESQEIAKAFGAACTPDFFLFNGDGGLFYAGQFDDARPRNGIAPSGADLTKAIDEMLSKVDVPSRQVPSSGCNIKWKVGNEPPYFG
jgi:peroxiredoxin